MHFIFWWFIAETQRWIKSEADGDAEKLKELCNAAIAWESRNPGCICKVYSPGNFSTKTVHEAPDELARVLDIRSRKATREARQVAVTATAASAADLPF